MGSACARAVDFEPPFIIDGGPEIVSNGERSLANSWCSWNRLQRQEVQIFFLENRDDGRKDLSFMFEQ